MKILIPLKLVDRAAANRVILLLNFLMSATLTTVSRA